MVNDFNNLLITGSNAIIVNDINDINLENSRSFGDLTLTAQGDIVTQDISTSSGDIQLISEAGEIDTTRGILSTRLPSRGSGNVLIKAPENVNLGDITASGFPSGSITLKTDSELTLDGANIRSILFGPDPGGEISVTADVLNLINGGRLRTSTNGDGNGSDLIVNAREFRVQGIAGKITGLGTDTRLGSSGNGGNIRINENIEAALIEIVGIDSQNFNPDPENPSSLLTATLLETGFTTATLGAGSSGNLTIANTTELTVSNGAGITTASLGISDNAGDAGTLSIDVDRAEFSGAAGLASATLGPGNAGDIKMTVETLSLQNGGTLSADAISSARLIEQLPDQDLDVESGLSEWLEVVQNTPPESIGLAGNVNVSSTRQILLDNRGRISTSSSATSGGNVYINTSFLSLRQGDGVGGIFTEGGLIDGVGNGGQIFIDADNIFAVEQENTDISARSFIGRGGGIRITNLKSDPIGIEFRPNRTPLSDITAGSDQGPQGTVDIETAGLNPTQGIANLPNEPSAPEIIEGCGVSGNREATQFFNNGREGIRPQPEDSLTPEITTIEWLTLDLAATTTTDLTADSEDTELTKNEVAIATCLLNSSTH